MRRGESTRRRAPTSRRRYLASVVAGVATALSGCSIPGTDSGSEPEAGATATPEPTVEPSADGEPGSTTEEPMPARLRVTDVSLNASDELQSGSETPVHVSAIVPVLHGTYELRAVVEFRSEQRAAATTTTRIEGRRETTYSREGAELTESIVADVPVRAAGRFDVVVALEDERGPGTVTATGRTEASVRVPAWQRSLETAAAALDEALAAFREGPDGTILDAGFDEFAYLSAIRPVRDADEALEAATDAVPADVDPGPVLDVRDVEIRLVERFVRIHRDLVEIFDDVAALRERIDAETATGRLRRSIEDAQDDVAADLTVAETLLDDLLEIADPPDAADPVDLRSDRYAEKHERLADHLSISRDVVEALTQFQRTGRQLRAAREAHGLGKRTSAERAIRRLDAFVRGIDPDGTPHASIEGQLGGVAHLDVDESLEPLIDAIVQMANERESTARQLRRDGIDERE